MGPHTSTVPATTDPRLLIVEDDDSMGDFVTRVLGRAGFDTVRVDTGEIALDALAGEEFDGLLVDLRLPGMDGLEVARKARAHHPALRIALMTAFAGTVGPNDLERCGVEDLLQKPLTPGGLTASMRQLMEVGRAGP